MRWIVLSCVVSLAACQTSGELAGQYRCEKNPACPDDYQCVAGLCVGAVPGVTACAGTDLFASTFDDKAWLGTVDVDLPQSGGGAVDIQDGFLVLTSNASKGAVVGVGTEGLVDLTVAPFVIEIDKVGGDFTELKLEDTAGKSFYFGIDPERRLNVYANDRTVVRRPYSPTSDRWLQIRVNDGIMTFETSPDGVAWALLTQDISPIDPRWVNIRILLESGGTVDTARIATLNPHASFTSRWCAASTWRDDFDTVALAPEADSAENNCTVAEGNGKLALTTRSGESYCGHYSNRPVDLRDGTITFKLTPAPNPAYTAVVLYSPNNHNRIEIEAQDDLEFVVRGGNQEIYSGRAPLPGTGEQYWRLSLAGAAMRIETSLDGVTWDLRSSTMVPALDASKMFLQRSLYAGSANTAVHRAQFEALR